MRCQGYFLKIALGTSLGTLPGEHVCTQDTLARKHARHVGKGARFQHAGHAIQQTHFAVITLLVLTLASDMAVLYGNDAFLILAISTKNGKTVLQFFEKGFRFPENLF